MKTGPIRPEDIPNAKRQHIPDKVFTAVNKLIALKFSNGQAKIEQNQILSEITSDSEHRSEIIAKGWLNFEEAYKEAGWDVEYDKPGHDESYAAFFVFKPKK